MMVPITTTLIILRSSFLRLADSLDFLFDLAIIDFF